MARRPKTYFVLAVVAVTLLVAAPSGAAPIGAETRWEGTFTYTIHELYGISNIDGSIVPGVPGLAVGDTFDGYFLYSSADADGMFGIPEDVDAGPLSVFRAFVPAPLSQVPTGGFYEFLDSVVPGPLITVSGGRVSDFFWHNEIGPVGVGFDHGTFHIVNSFNVDDRSNHARGTYQFADPQRVPEPSTMLLFGAGLLALSSLRRKTRR